MKTASAHGLWDAVLADAGRNPPASPARRLARALLFDVDRQSRSALEVVLAQRAFEVAACRTRAEFWARLHAEERALVVLGLTGSPSDDQDLLTRVTEVAAERGLPLLVIGGGPQGSAEHAYVPPLLAALPRPVPVAALRAALAAIDTTLFDGPTPTLPAGSVAEPAPERVDAPVRGVDLSTILDAGLRIQTLTPTGALRLGQPIKLLEGRPFVELLHPSERGVFESALADLDTPEASCNLRLQLSQGNDAWQEFDLRVTRQPDEPDGARYLLVGLQAPPNATAAAEVERMRTHLAAFVESAPLAVFSLDDQLRIAAWSDSARLHLGWEAADLVGRAPEEWVFIDEDARAGVVNELRSMAHDQRSRFVFKMQARTRDGSAQEIEWYCAVHRAASGALLSATCMGLDVSEQHQAQEVLRASEERFRALVQYASDIIAILDENATVQYLSPAAERVLGYALDELVGSNGLELVHPDDLPRAVQRLHELRETPGVALEPQELRVRHIDGEWRHLELRGANLYELPSVNGIVLNVRDVTEQRQAEEVLRRSEQRFRSLVRHSSDMLMVLDADGRVTYSSPAAEQLLGDPPNGRESQYAFTDVHPDDLPAVELLLAQALSRPDAVLSGEFRVRGHDGEWREVECRVRNLLSEPSVGGIVFNARDLTERRLAEQAARAGEERFRSLVQNASDMVTVIGLDGLISYQSPSIERILGYTPTEVEQRRLTDFIHPEDTARAVGEIERVMELERGTVRFDLRWRHANDSYRQIEAVCTNLMSDPSVQGTVINARDVTDRKSLERQLTRRAFLDSLTNLPNRLLFLHRLDRALQRAGGATHSVGVLFLDLDRFKVVNDSLGHEIGDQLLIAVAQRLRRIIRPADTVARLGGDEFIVLIEGAQQLDEIIRVAERIIEGLASPIRLNRHEVTVAASVGIAVGEGPSVTSQDLLRNADIALYRAKEQGSGQYVVFDASMAHQAVQRLALESDLRRAVQRNEFAVRYLPEIDLSTGKLAGLEVLVRWEHPVRGLIRPNEFIPVAEETGVIVPIGEWALRRACEQLRAWHSSLPATRELFLAVNLTAHEFQRHDLVEYITSTVQEAGLSPSMLRLEVSEAIMVAEPRSTLDKLRRLRERGVKLAIDDFGSGYSSLSYLTRVSFDTLKIDRQFVSGPGGVTSNLSIVRAVTSLAHALSMSVTAEGVETREHLTRVRAAGCDHGQGFLFSDALDAGAVERTLFARTAGP